MTPKMQAFINAIAAGAPNLEAAVAAGYSRATAHQAASRLLAHPEVKKGLKAARKQQAASSVAIKKGEKPPEGATAMRGGHKDSLEFMEEIMGEATLPLALRFEAAKQLLPYQHARIGEKGKKESKQDAAREVGRGKFAPKKPPALHVVK